MKYVIWGIIGLFVLSYGNNLYAQDTLKTAGKTRMKKEKQKMQLPFVDANGDGYNDNAPDDDGDGIPNGLDPDYAKKHTKSHFRDMNGDGIDDRLQPEMNGMHKGKMMGDGMAKKHPSNGMDGKGMKGHDSKGHGKGRKGMH